MNGKLGPKFHLHSGVAQGCPLSPLLFLVITEALTRLIVNDTQIEGVAINGTNHKITQYADDSTLIPKHAADWHRMAAHLATWCDATSMKENATKREGQLLGKLKEITGLGLRQGLRLEPTDQGSEPRAQSQKTRSQQEKTRTPSIEPRA